MWTTTWNNGRGPYNGRDPSRSTHQVLLRSDVRGDLRLPRADHILLPLLQ